MRILIISLVVLGALSFTAPCLVAQTAGDVESDRALQLVQEGKLEEAIEVWLNLGESMAPDDSGRWAVHRNLGRSFQKLGKWPEAWWHFSRAIELNQSEAGKAVEWKKEVEDQLGASGYRKVELVGPAGGQVGLVHGAKERWFSLPLVWYFKPGTHSLVTRAPGFKEARHSFVVGATTSKLELKLEKVVPMGRVLVERDGKDCDVLVDGLKVGKCGVDVEVAAGLHRLVAQGLDGPLLAREISVVAGETLKVEVEETAISDGAVWGGWPWVLAGASLAFAGAGAGFWFAADDELSSLSASFAKDNNLPRAEMTAQELVTMRSAWDREVDSSVTPLETGSYVMFGLAGAAAVGAVVMYLVSDGDSASDNAALPVGVVVAPGVFGLDLDIMSITSGL